MIFRLAEGLYSAPHENIYWISALVYAAGYLLAVCLTYAYSVPGYLAHSVAVQNCRINH